MISSLFNTLVYNPLYNGLVFLIDLIPWADIGVIVILFTIAVRLILYPLSKASVRTQIKMREINPEINKIKETYKDNKQKQAEEIMSVYRKNGINPFSGFFLMFIQIPIIIALYLIFYKGGLPIIDSNIVYSFIDIPEPISMKFLGLIDMSEKRNIILAILAGISQFFQAKFAMPKMSEKQENSQNKPSFSDDLMKSMNVQMKYVMPVIIAIASYSISGAVALYWVTSNIFTIGQEIFVRNSHKKEIAGK